jgi:hypothetical protein
MQQPWPEKRQRGLTTRLEETLAKGEDNLQLSLGEVILISGTILIPGANVVCLSCNSRSCVCRAGTGKIDVDTFHGLASRLPDHLVQN